MAEKVVACGNTSGKDTWWPVPRCFDQLSDFLPAIQRSTLFGMDACSLQVDAPQSLHESRFPIAILKKITKLFQSGIINFYKSACANFVDREAASENCEMINEHRK